MAAIAWSSFLPFILVASLLIYDEWVSSPSCKFIPRSFTDKHDSDLGLVSHDLKVMIVANLLLLGSEDGFVNRHFRDYYMSKFFRKSFDRVNPDMLLVLGDVSAKGSELTGSEWLSVLHQFHQILGPFLSLPFHVTLGDRDVGDCSWLDLMSVNSIAENFPGLDSSGCGSFEISNVSFVSLNAAALLCGNNKLRFSIEKAIERESIYLRMDSEVTIKAYNATGKKSTMSHDFSWRENSLLSGFDPVLLLHFPLHRTVGNKCSTHISNTREAKESKSSAPYDLLHTIPPNASEYIFQALKPRIVFSAHTHEFCDYTHSDGTREVTVPAMTWKVKDDPGFIVATFRGNSEGVSVSYCSLARESHLLIAYTSLSILLLLIVLSTNAPLLRCLRR